MLKSLSANKLPEVNPGAKSRFSYPRGNTQPCSDMFPCESLLWSTYLLKTNTIAQEKALYMLTATFLLQDQRRCFMMALHRGTVQQYKPGLALRTRFRHVFPEPLSAPSISNTAGVYQQKGHSTGKVCK